MISLNNITLKQLGQIHLGPNHPVPTPDKPNAVYNQIADLVLKMEKNEEIIKQLQNSLRGKAQKLEETRAKLQRLDHDRAAINSTLCNLGAESGE